MHLLTLAALVVVSPSMPFDAPAVMGRATLASAQTAPAQQPPAQQPPAQQPPAGQPPPSAPKRPPRAATTSRTTLDVEVTTTKGEPLSGVTVRATGPVEREATTNASGVAKLVNLRAGTYRVRFEAERFVTFEREVIVPTTGKPAPVEIALDAAPEPPRPEPSVQAPPPAPADANRPVGTPATLDVTSFIEKNFIGRSEPQKISVLGCTGYATTRLLQVREPLADRLHADADETLFVVAGEAIVSMGGREQSLEPNGLVIVPRGTGHTITRRGRNPAILLSVLSGPPCTESTK